MRATQAACWKSSRCTAHCASARSRMLLGSEPGDPRRPSAIKEFLGSAAKDGSRRGGVHQLPDRWGQLARPALKARVAVGPAEVYTLHSQESCRVRRARCFSNAACSPSRVSCVIPITYCVVVTCRLDFQVVLCASTLETGSDFYTDQSMMRLCVRREWNGTNSLDWAFVSASQSCVSGASGAAAAKARTMEPCLGEGGKGGG